MTQAVVLGLDISKTNTAGILLGQDGKLVHQFQINCAGMASIKAMHHAANAMLDVLNTYKPALTVMEGYGFANAHTLVPIVEIGTMVRYALNVTMKLPFATVAPNALKKFVLGTGTGKKEKMILGVYKTWGVEFDTNDLADAYGCARIARAMRKYDPVNATKAEVLQKLLVIPGFSAG